MMIYQKINYHPILITILLKKNSEQELAITVIKSRKITVIFTSFDDKRNGIIINVGQ
jgi:hypothetical protein